MEAVELAGSSNVPDESQLSEWILALKDCDSQHSEGDSYRRLAYALEGVILHCPAKAVEFLKTYKDSGIRFLPGLQSLTGVLARELVIQKEVGELEELLGLGAGWNIPEDATVLKELAKIYAQQGDVAKAHRTWQRVLKRDPCDADVLRAVYGLAKGEGKAAEAHSLLNRLLEVDPSPGTFAFAYRERSKLLSNSGRPVRIALLSSYVLDQLIHYMDFECRKIGLEGQFYLGPFNQYAQEILQPSSGLYDFSPEIIFISVALDDLFPEVRGYPPLGELEKASKEIRDRMSMLAHELHGRSSALIVLHEFTLMHRTPHGILDNRSQNGLGRWLEDLNHALAEDLRSLDRAYLLPLSEVLSWVGKERACNPKMQYMASMRIGESALRDLARYSMRYVKPIKGLTRKCVVLDLDGTLWGGIVGEVGVEGIHLGPTAPGIEYLDFQRALLNLTRRGTLLAVCSKNNPEDALAVLRNHEHMLLREEHFGAMRINWCNKAENLMEIAEELNIGLDSMVFIDDNPNERELIRQMLPEVLTPEWPADPSRYRMALEELSDFELLALTKEDEMRVPQYRAGRQRQALRDSAPLLEEYLGSLAIKAMISLAGEEALPRLVQMFNKTNQFNLTTRRYQSADMQNFIKSKEHRVYVLQVSDRFGDHGMAGAAIVQEADCQWRIDSLLMSCRIMGLSVETAFLERIWQDARVAGVTTLVGEFIETNKNQPAKLFYPGHGFNLSKHSESLQLWELIVPEAEIQKPAWIATTGQTTRHDS